MDVREEGTGFIAALFMGICSGALPIAMLTAHRAATYEQRKATTRPRSPNNEWRSQTSGDEKSA